MVTPQPAFRATSADHEHLVGETCPYCEQPIPNDRAEEIRARYEFKQQQSEAALKARAEKQIAEARAALEVAKKAEIEKIRADALAQTSAALEAGKKVAAEEARKKIEALNSAREADALKVTEAEQKRLVEKFWHCLNPGGYLFVGHAESLFGLTHKFRMVHENNGTAYQRTEANS